MTASSPAEPLALTVAQAADLAGVSRDALYEAIARGESPWPVLRIGRCIRLPRSAVLASLGVEPGDGECDDAR